MSVNPRRSASATSSSISACRIAGGFSTKTCLPASSARSASSWCVGTGVAITTASSESSASSSSNDSVTRACGKRRANCSRSSGDESQSHRQLGELVEVADEVLAPVAEADLADEARLSPARHSFQTLPSASWPFVALRKSTTRLARRTTSP